MADTPAIEAPAGGARLCAFDGPGAALDTDRPARASRLSLSPGIFGVLRTRPGLESVLDDAQVLGRTGHRFRSAYRVALPEQVIRWELDQPRGAAIYTGRNDARCVVVARWQRDPLEVHLRGVPVRVVDASRRVASAIVDVKLTGDAELVLVHRQGDPLPFERAQLANGALVAANLGAQITLAQHLGWGAK